MLIRTVAAKAYGLDPAGISFSVQEYGKPYIPALPDMHFNISHSGRWIVCAVDSKPIGIDIEKMKPGTIDIAKRFFRRRNTVICKRNTPISRPIIFTTCGR